MSDTPHDLAAQLAAQLAALQPKVTGWGVQASPLTPTGLAVPVKLQTPAGDIRVYLQLPAECAADPNTIMATLQALSAQGYPLDTWQPRDSGGGWGSSGGGGGGWNRNSGGGWNRGGGGGWRR